MTFLQPVVRFFAGAITLAETAVGGWLALLVRLWLAQAFLVAQVHTMMAGPSLASPLSPGWWPGIVHGVAASGPGAAVQAVCPVLLALGLLSRPAAAAMLLQALLMGTPGVAGETQVFWAALLLRIVTVGPGPFALDTLMRGADSVALPLAAPVQRWFAWSRRTLGPIYQFLLRVWLAAAPAGIALSALRVMQPGGAGWLPQVPSMMAGLAPSVALGVAGLLVVGAGVRFVALGLLALMPLSQLDAGDTRLYWALLLATLLAYGAGRASADGWIKRRLQRMAGPVDRSAWPHVVVVGADRV